MNTQTEFTKGQTLFFLNKDKVPVKCEYIQHFRAVVHVVLVTEGPYQGRHWKDADELFTETPEQA